MTSLQRHPATIRPHRPFLCLLNASGVASHVFTCFANRRSIDDRGWRAVRAFADLQRHLPFASRRSVRFAWRPARAACVSSERRLRVARRPRERGAVDRARNLRLARRATRGRAYFRQLSGRGAAYELDSLLDAAQRGADAAASLYAVRRAARAAQPRLRTHT